MDVLSFFGYAADNKLHYDEYVMDGVAAGVIVVVLLFGLIWYLREKHAQRQRLILIDEANPIKGSSLSYTSPDIDTFSSEAEG
jgi:hypothetical protein